MLLECRDELEKMLGSGRRTSTKAYSSEKMASLLNVLTELKSGGAKPSVEPAPAPVGETVSGF
jgi:hypothetical protein